MTREEAIRILASSCIPGSKQTEALETLIPELAESEDERIRKDIVSHFESIKAQALYDRQEESDSIVSSCNEKIAYLEKQKYNRMQPVYDNQESFESALDKAWKSYNDCGSRTVDSCEDDYIECAHAKGFREGYLFGIEKQKENPKTADSIPSDCVSDAKCEDRWYKVQDFTPADGRLVLAKDNIGNYLLASFAGGEWFVERYDLDDVPMRHTYVTEWCEIPSEKQKEQKPIIQDVELNDAVYDYVRDHFIAGADFTPEYIKKLMENAFFAGVDYYLLKQESESCEPDTNVEKVIEDVIRVYGKTQGEWVGGYDVDTLIVNLRRAFNKKEQKPAESISQLAVQGKGVYKICPRCKERMVRDDSMVYTSMPPQYRYECPKCGEREFDTVMYDNPEMEEQKPAEWSEEDKEALDMCIDAIPKAWKTKSGTLLTDWLKEHLRPSWKPSEEQMKALQNAVALTACDKELARLYNQLEKL